MREKPILVIMAAGMGSRYGGLKQIDPVGPSGEAIIDYSLYDARRAGFETVVFIIKHEIEEPFKAAVGARALQAGFEVRYAYQQLDCLPEGFTVPDGRVKPWGTAHAILTAEQAIGSAPFAVINADDYYGPQGFKLVYDYLSSHADGDRYAWSMVGFLLGNTVSANGSVSRGVCVTDEHSNLVSVTERTCIEPYDGGIHYTECQLDRPARRHGRLDEPVGLHSRLCGRGQGRVCGLFEGEPAGEPAEMRVLPAQRGDRRFAARRCRRTCTDQPRQVARHHLPRGQARTGSRPAPDEQGRAVPQR